MASPRIRIRPAEYSASPPTAVWSGRVAACVSKDRSSHDPRDADTPTATAGDGRVTTRPTSCLPPLLSCRRGSESEPTVTAPVHSTMPFTPCAWTPMSHREVLISGSPGAGRGVADGKTRQPAAAAHPQQVVGVGGQRVGPNREQVLIGERLADQDVAAAVRGARHGAERRWNAARLQIEAAVRPRADADEQTVRVEEVALVQPQLAQHLHVFIRADLRGHTEAEVADRAVFVARVVEEARIFGRDRRDDFRAEHEVPAARSRSAPPAATAPPRRALGRMPAARTPATRSARRCFLNTRKV